jgi:hypothetical protein
MVVSHESLNRRGGEVSYDCCVSVHWNEMNKSRELWTVLHFHVQIESDVRWHDRGWFGVRLSRQMAETIWKMRTKPYVISSVERPDKRDNIRITPIRVAR